MIPTGQVSLAHTFDPAKDEVRDWIAEPKLDGVRCILYQGYAVTRAGKPIPSVSDLARHFAQLPFALDGELLLPGATFEQTVGEVRQKQRVSDRLVFHAFDVIPTGEDASTPFLERRRALVQALVQFPHARATMTPWEPCVDALQACERYVAMGFEGVMLKDPGAPYTPGRSRAVLKMKPWFDTNATVAAAIAGEGKHAGRLGALVVDTDEGVRCKVGTGFSDCERQALWDNRDGLVGSVVEICYQERTERGALRFPTFRRIRSDL